MYTVKQEGQEAHVMNKCKLIHQDYQFYVTYAPKLIFF